MQTVANLAGSSSLHVQTEINRINLDRLRLYVEKHIVFLKASSKTCESGSGVFADAARYQDASAAPMLRARLAQITQLVSHQAQAREKCTEILFLTSDLARALGGGRVTVCKSAKDRTSMSVTLEQTRLLQELHGLLADNALVVTELMRRHGVRRENTGKNTGVRRYCFNRFQQIMLPRIYAPPAGTGGGKSALS
jgi:hypothetical protein